ncbi:MAG TPA: Ig-like domain-containing protein [Terriglobales bacterium]|nr:Ig-like domain-containing protein [Terriglobales bacterium]
MLNIKQKPKVAGTLVVALVCAIGPGCNGFFVNPTLTSITVGPSATINQNGTVQMSAVGTFNDGSTQSLSNVFWSSSDTTVAAINGAGLVTGISPGSATITGASGTVSGTATVTVSISNVTGITISPTSANATINGTQSFKAMATVSGGSPVDVTTTATWTISATSSGSTADFTIVGGQDPAVVTVQATAMVGEVATVTATYVSGVNTFTANAMLRVTQ